SQTSGLQGEVDDDVWVAIWESIEKVEIADFDAMTVTECHRWVSLAARNTNEKFVHLLQDLPPSSHLIKQVLVRLTSTQELWTTCRSENSNILKKPAHALSGRYVRCFEAYE
ncbi:hypothetical protein BGX26_004507, partial [Mortierella sp. AD094]